MTMTSISRIKKTRVTFPYIVLKQVKPIIYR